MQLCRRNTSYIFFSFSTEETQVKFSFFFYTGAQFYTFLSFDQGMKYIHDSPLESHGSLRSACCLIDSRWVLKVCDFGLHWLTCHDGSTEGSHKHQKGWCRACDWDSVVVCMRFVFRFLATRRQRDVCVEKWHEVHTTSTFRGLGWSQSYILMLLRL